jgi:hypothetical protein
MASVNFNGHTISSEEVKLVLQAVCDFFQANVFVTSGNRDFVPPGGSQTSWHLSGKAADFYVEGNENSTVFMYMKVFVSNFFKMGNKYEFINHGSYTGTTGKHLHLACKGSTNDFGYVEFIEEGLTSSTKNIYKTVANIPLIGATLR